TVTFSENVSTPSGLVVSPSSIDQIVNVNQTKGRTVRLTNYSAATRQFTAGLENSFTADISFTDSDQTGGPAFVWNDISATGTKLNEVSDADEATEQVDLSFDLPYFGSSYRNIFVTSNGFITVGEQSEQYDNYALPGTDMP